MLNGYYQIYSQRMQKSIHLLEVFDIKISDIAPDNTLCQEKENKNVV